MEIFLGVLFVMIAAGTIYSAWTSSRAFSGVEFTMGVGAPEVARALSEMYSQRGVKGAMKDLVRGIQVETPHPRPDGSYAATYSTTIGDQGVIEITPDSAGALVRAKAEVLFRGKKRRGNYKSGFYQMTDALSALMMTTLRIRPNAPKLMRFHGRLQGKIERQLTKVAR